MTVKEALHILQTDDVAQDVLGSPLVARLEYTWRDGSPRVVPMCFDWTGEEILMGAPLTHPRLKCSLSALWLRSASTLLSDHKCPIGKRPSRSR